MIALIAISVGVGVSSSIPLWMILVLPFMFTCGMVLVDTTDAVAMRVAYGWALLKPIRKIYYNMTITVILCPRRVCNRWCRSLAGPFWGAESEWNVLELVERTGL